MNSIQTINEAKKYTDDEFCINKFLQFDYDGNNVDALDYELMNILSLYDNTVNKENPVIIYLGYDLTFLKIIERIDQITRNDNNINSVVIISSDAVNPNFNLPIDTKITCLSISFENLSQIIYNYSTNAYYKNISLSYLNNEDSQIGYIPFINKYFQEKHGCSLNKSLPNACSIDQINNDTLSNAVYMQFLIYTMIGFVEEFKTTYVKICPKNPGLDNCDKLYDNSGMKLFTNNLRTMSVTKVNMVYAPFQVTIVIRILINWFKLFYFFTF